MAKKKNKKRKSGTKEPLQKEKSDHTALLILLFCLAVSALIGYGLLETIDLSAWPGALRWVEIFGSLFLSLTLILLLNPSTGPHSPASGIVEIMILVGIPTVCLLQIVQIFPKAVLISRFGFWFGLSMIVSLILAFRMTAEKEK